jgi:hypothetical protein
MGLNPPGTKDAVTVASELQAAAAARRDVTPPIGTTHPRVRLALAILRNTPDLAEAVSAGQLDLVPAHRALKARKKPAHDAPTVTYLTVVEVASLPRVREGRSTGRSGWGIWRPSRLVRASYASQNQPPANTWSARPLRR